MTKLLQERPGLEIIEVDGDFTSVTKVFKVSRATVARLQESWESLAAVLACPSQDYGFPAISVEGSLEEDESWTGWGWLHDELVNIGVDPEEYNV